MEFWKYQGLGNDFILVEERINPKTVPFLCDRRYGIGADSLLVVDTKTHSVPQMIIYNADGSRAEMCGNGLRCTIFHLFTKTQQKEWTILTDVGKRKGCLIQYDDHISEVKVEIGPPVYELKKIPVKDKNNTEWVNHPLKIKGHTVHFTAVSMGNPHIVTFDNVDENTKILLSPLLEYDNHFPQRTNVGWAKWDEENKIIELRVWERGCGFTEACGSGASAAVAAAYKLGYISTMDTITVKQKGGDLIVLIDKNGHIWIQGYANFVFKGQIDKLERIKKI